MCEKSVHCREDVLLGFSFGVLGNPYVSSDGAREDVQCDLAFFSQMGVESDIDPSCLAAADCLLQLYDAVLKISSGAPKGVLICENIENQTTVYQLGHEIVRLFESQTTPDEKTIGEVVRACWADEQTTGCTQTAIEIWCRRGTVTGTYFSSVAMEEALTNRAHGERELYAIGDDGSEIYVEKLPEVAEYELEVPYYSRYVSSDRSSDPKGFLSAFHDDILYLDYLLPSTTTS